MGMTHRTRSACPVPNWLNRYGVEHSNRFSMTLRPLQCRIEPTNWYGACLWGCFLACVLAVGCGRKAGAVPLVSPIVSSLLPVPTPLTLFVESFDHLDAQRWREVEVKGQTEYTIEEQEGGRYLKAHSRGGASILLSLFRFDPETYEWLSWRWKADTLIEGEDLSTKAGSDAVARVYVYFDTPGLPWQRRAMDYVWSSIHPAGMILTSPFTGHSKILVIENGAEHLGQWRSASRNIEDDYEQCFGEDPPDVVAIGLMTDADSTNTEAVAYYDDVMITREPPPEHPSWSSP